MWTDAGPRECGIHAGMRNTRVRVSIRLSPCFDTCLQWEKKKKKRDTCAYVRVGLDGQGGRSQSSQG